MRSFKRNIYRLSTETAYSCDLSNGTAVEVTAPIVCISYNVEIPEVDTVTISYYDCNNNFVPLEPLTGPDNIQFCAKEGTVLTVPNGTSVVTAVGSCGTTIAPTLINTGTFGAGTYLEAICEINTCYPNTIPPLNMSRYSSTFPIVIGTIIYDNLSPLTRSAPLSSTYSYYAYTMESSTEKWFRIDSLGVVIEAGEYL